jgi:hypothetical protein
MNVALDPESQKRIRNAVKPGDPWALDELTEEICGDDRELHREFSKVVADEYQRRLSAMPRQQMRELYRRCYKEQTDANKDWLLGEIVEGIEAGEN